MTYFTADLHLGHKAIINLCHRPFQTIEEMDETLIANWNKRVKKNDTVYIVGDLVWEKCKPDKYLSRLNGKKILILGNHDKWAKRGEYNEFFEKITNYEETNLNCHPVTLCHYPMLEWKNSRKVGSKKLGYLIHGHIHGNVRAEYRLLFETPNVLNAGVDINHYKPVTFDELVVNNAEFSSLALEKLNRSTVLDSENKD